MARPPMKSLARYLDFNGDGTGGKNANGNYASAADILYIQPPAGYTFHIARMIVEIEDTGVMRAEYYGSTNGALTNGIQVREQDDSGTINDLTDGVPIKTNAGWGSQCYDVDVKSWGAGNEVLLVRWTFAASGAPIVLDGANNERLEVVLNDDLSGLVEHRFMVQGLVTDLNG